jgi:hypothetical protein
MARIAGSYTTQRDGGLTYTYEATWHESGDGVVWSARVRRGGESAGAPSGQIRKSVGIPIEREVRRVVEKAIETRAGVKR